MNPTELKTVAVPQITTARRPATAAEPAQIAFANNNRVLRVLVANVSVGVDVKLAFAVNDVVNPLAASGVFILQAGKSEVFPLAPGQTLFAGSSGVDALVSVCVSDALPLDVKA